MKKLFALIAAVALVVIPAAAKNHVHNDPSVLPSAARTMLKKYFPKTAIHHIKIDSKVIGGKDYEVVLTDGTEIDFNNDGSWTEIDCGRSAVPSGLLLPAITQYVAKNFKGAKIVQVEVNRNSYEVELSTGVDLKFDRAGNFLKIDD